MRILVARTYREARQWVDENYPECTNTIYILTDAHQLTGFERGTVIMLKSGWSARPDAKEIRMWIAARGLNEEYV